MSRPNFLALLLFLCALATPVSHAQSGVYRCVNAVGENIYSDKACSESQAVDRPTTPTNLVNDGHRVVVARTCARKPEELLSDVRNALAAQDVNRLAGTYLWTGMGSREAYSLMDRLSTFSARPLVDAQLMTSLPELDSSASDMAPTIDSPEPEPTEETTAPTQPPPPPAPDLIRVEQTRAANDVATATSYLRIVPAAGCLWISF